MLPEKNSGFHETKNQVLVCRGTGCESQEANNLYSALREEVTKAGLGDKLDVIFTGCHGLCQMGPTVLVALQGTFYCKVKPQDAAEIVGTDLKNGGTVERLLFKDTKSRERVVRYKDMDYFRAQSRVVLRNCGFINPEKIDDYIQLGGYEGIRKAFTM